MMRSNYLSVFGKLHYYSLLLEVARHPVDVGIATTVAKRRQVPRRGG